MLSFPTYFNIIQYTLYSAKFLFWSNEFTVSTTMSGWYVGFFSLASFHSWFVGVLAYLFSVIQQQLQTHIVFVIYYCSELKEFRLFPFPFQFQSRFRFLAAVEIQNASNIALKTLFIGALVNATGNICLFQPIATETTMALVHRQKD